MATWIEVLWQRLHGSLWFVPGIITMAAAAMAFAAAEFDRSVTTGHLLYPLLYQGDADGARTLLSTVAGSMITVAGVTFSATMVALSLASSQFGPRLLTSFMRDRGNQIVLGAFIGTFLFCLLALGSLPERDGEFVSASASMGLVMAVVSLALLVYFIHHIASSMQADVVIDQVAGDLDRDLQRIFPDGQRRDVDEEPDVLRGDGAEGDMHLHEIGSPQAGYLQVIDEAGLLRLACKHDLRLEVVARPGHFLLAGARVVRVTSAEGISEAVQRQICRSFKLGGRRTAEQDPEFGVNQLVEIAVRALSPGVNDPFTAIACVDRLSGVLGRVARCAERSPLRRDAQGVPRLRLDRIDFAGVLDAAMNQIRQCSADVPSVAIRMLEALTAIAAVTDDGGRRRALARHGRLVFDGSAPGLGAADLAVLEGRYGALRRQLADVEPD